MTDESPRAIAPAASRWTIHPLLRKPNRYGANANRRGHCPFTPVPRTAPRHKLRSHGPRVILPVAFKRIGNRDYALHPTKGWRIER